MRKWTKVTLPTDGLREKLISLAASYPYFCFLDNAKSEVDRYGKYEWILGMAGADAEICTNWTELENGTPKWRMGGLTYALKDKFEPSLSSHQPASISLPEVLLFSPQIMLRKLRNSRNIEIWAENPELVTKEILEFSIPQKLPLPAVQLRSNFSREDYLKTISQIREHIREGDVYELNLCQEFTGKAELEQPWQFFLRLVDRSPMPFSALFRWQDVWVMGASPERFLQFQDGILRTQPIKGTAPRGKNQPLDLKIQEALCSSEKERAENVMIVDLARNDLHRSCETGSVSVPHLFEVQTFPQLHQLVSTIEGRLRNDISPLQALKSAFPPGSMTGAPKVKSCELIERYERSARGLYAGSIGWLNPEGDFDWNVVIRTLFYDAVSHQLSYHVGGAITYDSDPEAEFEETLLKARAIEAVLSEEG